MQTIEVRFKGNRRAFYDWPDLTYPLRVNEAVLVEADRGLDFGRVNTVGDAALKKCGGCTSCAVAAPAETNSAAGETPTTNDAAAANEVPAAVDAPASSDVAAAPAEPPRPKVVRRAHSRDVAQHEELRRGEEIARRQVSERAHAHDLPMRISDTEWQWDRNRLTIYFTSETRVDFRNLVRELATHFRTRIELRQIGVRDEAARLGGVGRCGREFCCSTWLTEPSPVNLSLAKDQHLSLNPSQISGGCGRLLCCLKYEHEFYLEARKRFPKEGKSVITLRGTEKVIAVDIFRERVFLRSDEHGSRIIAVLDLRDEQARAAAAAPASPGA
ncbi:MAG TPA: regulatory iron-sulfur-containing complex subunit RicT [Gemmatimonadales bacterium]|jgi:cell fate regulator YaaT (PSP1 superfamily)|nr:regulatory iron-sulfur-containing complex subunit RicT [Gemmatimonadales bacterium]